MELLYIKANGQYYRPQKAGVQDPRKRKGFYYPVCKIKKLWFGRWRVDYYDEFMENIYPFGEERDTNTALILYPNGIEEIKYLNR